MARLVGATGWHPEEIKAAIRMRGTTLADLSRAHGYDPDAVRLAIRLRRSYAVEAIVAKVLGVTPQQIWPDRYDATGKPLDNRRHHKHRPTASRSSKSPTPSRHPRAA